MLDSVAIKRINPEAVPGPRSDYSLVTVVDAGHAMVYIAGQTGRRQDGSIDPESHMQAAAAFDNLDRLLLTVDSSPRNIVHLRTYVVGRVALQGFVAARSTVFESWFEGLQPPTNTLAIVSGLADPNALVEIEAVAVVSPGPFDNPDHSK